MTGNSDEGDGLSSTRFPAYNGSLHERSLSVESDYSFFSEDSADSEAYINENSNSYDSPLKPGNVLQHSDPSSPLFSPTSPPHVFTTAITDLTFMSTIAEDPIGSSNVVHGRNVFYSNTRHLPPSKLRLIANKSSPELRNIASNLSSEREASQKPTTSKSNFESEPARGSKPRHSRNAEGHQDDINSFPRATTSKYNRATRSLPSNNRNGSTHVFAESASSPVPNLPKPAPSMDVERNSYFRRLSTLLPLSMEVAMPEALVAMVESARGILFGVSQIYQSLRHYTVFAIDDRLSGVLVKVLNPASTYMTHLINALERFDSVSRRGIPSPSVCRGVLESCRDNVAGFGKVIGVLNLQLKVLAGADDARYSRGLILMLYGSMGEIANSWGIMSSHLDAILPFLSERPRPFIPAKLQQQPTPSHPPNTPSPTRETHPQLPAPGGNGSDGPSRLTRRHAGSFSTKDLEIGKTLPSTKVSQSSLVELIPSKGHIQQEPSILGSDTSSPPFPFIPPNSVVHSTPRPVHSSLDVPSDSSKMVDEDLLDTMEAATETARSVWKMMDEVLHTSKDVTADLQDSLVVATGVTAELKMKIDIMRRGASDEDRKSFWEVAHSFVRVSFPLESRRALVEHCITGGSKSADHSQILFCLISFFTDVEN